MDNKTKLALTDEQLAQVSGGVTDGNCGKPAVIKNGKCERQVTAAAGQSSPCDGCKYR